MKLKKNKRAIIHFIKLLIFFMLKVLPFLSVYNRRYIESRNYVLKKNSMKLLLT